MTGIYHNMGRSYKNFEMGYITKEEFKEICIKYGSKCVSCGSQEILTLDHIRPLAYGGKNEINNIQPLCKSCNSKKGPLYKDYRPDGFNDENLEKECKSLYMADRKEIGQRSKATKKFRKENYVSSKR